MLKLAWRQTPALRKRCQRMKKQAEQLLGEISFKSNIHKVFRPKISIAYVAKAVTGELYVFARITLLTWNVEYPNRRIRVRASFKILQSDLDNPSELYRLVYKKILKVLRHELSEGMFANEKPIFKASHSAGDSRDWLWGFACE